MRARRVARWLWFLGPVGLLPAFTAAPGSLRVFLLCFFAPLAADAVRWARRRPADPPPEGPAAPGIPLPAPARRYGAPG
ncbi:MAG TPA: hypothetical protein VHG51_10565, partial [Longimicrobiaceae bacterium]|nr:hypothetical protein [Longimicrobiaceae bacterium]